MSFGSFNGCLFESVDADDMIPQTPSCGFIQMRKWSKFEDSILNKSIKRNGMHNWQLTANDVPGRSSDECHKRWIELQSQPTWTAQEDAIILQLQRKHGNLWTKISRFLPGRSANDVKNRFKSLDQQRISPTLAAQMMPIMAQQQFDSPSTQISQQTAPSEILWGDTDMPDTCNNYPFSDDHIGPDNNDSLLSQSGESFDLGISPPLEYNSFGSMWDH